MELNDNLVFSYGTFDIFLIMTENIVNVGEDLRNFNQDLMNANVMFEYKYGGLISGSTEVLYSNPEQIHITLDTIQP